MGVTFWKRVVEFPNSSYVLVCPKPFLPVASASSSIATLCRWAGMCGSSESERLIWVSLSLLIHHEAVLLSVLLCPSVSLPLPQTRPSEIFHKGGG